MNPLHYRGVQIGDADRDEDDNTRASHRQLDQSSHTLADSFPTGAVLKYFGSKSLPKSVLVIILTIIAILIFALVVLSGLTYDTLSDLAQFDQTDCSSTNEIGTSSDFLSTLKPIKSNKVEQVIVTRTTSTNKWKLFTNDAGRVYSRIPKEDIGSGNAFLMIEQLSSGIGLRDLYWDPGGILSQDLVYFRAATLAHHTLQLIAQQSRYRSSAGATAKSFPASILWSFAVLDVSEAGYLLDLTDFLLAPLGAQHGNDLPQAITSAYGDSYVYAIDRTRSFIDHDRCKANSVRAQFPRNMTYVFQPRSLISSAQSDQGMTVGVYVTDTSAARSPPSALEDTLAMGTALTVSSRRTFIHLDNYRQLSLAASSPKSTMAQPILPPGQGISGRSQSSTSTPAPITTGRSRSRDSEKSQLGVRSGASISSTSSSTHSTGNTDIEKETYSSSYRRRPYHPMSGFNSISFMDEDASLLDARQQLYITRHWLPAAAAAAATGATSGAVGSGDASEDETGAGIGGIVYYIDAAAPALIRDALVEGVGWWDQAFQYAGFPPGTFRAEVAPSTDPAAAIESSSSSSSAPASPTSDTVEEVGSSSSGFDQYDFHVPRRHFVEWIDRDLRAYSLGLRVEDPRSGEVLKGYARIEALRMRQDALIAQALLLPFGDAGGEGGGASNTAASGRSAVTGVAGVSVLKTHHSAGETNKMARSSRNSQNNRHISILRIFRERLSNSRSSQKSGKSVPATADRGALSALVATAQNRGVKTKTLDSSISTPVGGHPYDPQNATNHQVPSSSATSVSESVANSEERQDAEMIVEKSEGGEKGGEEEEENALVEAILGAVLQRVRQLGAHEVGHSLGLAHNFAGSSSATHGPFSSVMDYPPPLVTLDSSGTGLVLNNQSYGDGVGFFDKIAISYGYSTLSTLASRRNISSTSSSPISESGISSSSSSVSEEEERVALYQLLADAEEQGYLFLTDQDSGVESSDWRATKWDAGTSPVAALNTSLAVRRLALLRLDAGALRQWSPLSELQEVFPLVYLWHRYEVGAVAKLLGGTYFQYVLKGDVALQQTVESVPAEEQLQALEKLLEAFSPAQLSIPPTLLRHLLPMAFGYTPDIGGVADLFASRAGAGSFDPVVAYEGAAHLLLSAVLSPARVERLAVQRLHKLNQDQSHDQNQGGLNQGKGQNASLPDLLSVLGNFTAAVFSPVAADAYSDTALLELFTCQSVLLNTYLELSSNAKALSSSFVVSLVRYHVQNSVLPALAGLVDYTSEARFCSSDGNGEEMGPQQCAFVSMQWQAHLAAINTAALSGKPFMQINEAPLGPPI